VPRTRLAAIFALLPALASPALAQLRIIDTPSTQTTPATPTPATPREASTSREQLSPDDAVIIAARRALAADRPGEARRTLTKWLNANQGSEHPLLPEAHYLRGNALLAQDDEFEALYDYEEVIKNHPASEFFVSSLERELDIARLYLNGRRKPTLGLRIDSGVPLAEEIIIRIGERLPGSKLAERALLELADFYARTRDLRMAAETYDVFLRLFPRSDLRQKAMQRRIYANVAQFKGPGYDASVMREAAVLIDDFQNEFPAQAQQSGLTDALVARLDESAGATMLRTARWYLDRGDPVSARLTARRLVRRHPRTASAHEALELIQRIDKEHPAISGGAGDAQPADQGKPAREFKPVREPTR
jgi:tetratricopeptide (TPR) repeat protein